jgi:hypothetical protein
MIYKIQIITLLFILLMKITACTAQASNWVYAQGEGIMDERKSLQDVKNEAISNARQSAIEQRIGVQIQAETMVKDFVLQSEYVSSLSTGHVVEEEVLKWEVENIQNNNLKPPVMVYKVKIRARVEFERSPPDPAFKIYCILNRSVFRDGDEVILKIKVTEDSYINIFTITQNDQVYLIYPNKYKIVNYIKKDKEFIFPSKSDNEKGFKLKVGLLPGSDKTTERFKVVATKKQIKIIPYQVVEADSLDVFAKESVSIQKIVSELMLVPASERTEITVPYSIVK